MDLSQLEEAYRQFVQEVKKRFFSERNIDETCTGVSGLGLVRPSSRRYQEPGEICFIYKPPPVKIQQGNDYTVVVCSTKRRIGWVGKDCGWVIIVAGQKGNERRVYSSYPLVRRSETFFDRLLFEAKAARWRVLHRPCVCAKGCEAPMLLVPRRGRLKSRYWKCALHPEDTTHNRAFDDLAKPLPDEALALRKANRAGRRKRREKVRRDDGDPFAALKARIAHPWVRKEKQIAMGF